MITMILIMTLTTKSYIGFQEVALFSEPLYNFLILQKIFGHFIFFIDSRSAMLIAVKQPLLFYLLCSF